MSFPPIDPRTNPQPVTARAGSVDGQPSELAVPVDGLPLRGDSAHSSPPSGHLPASAREAPGEPEVFPVPIPDEPSDDTWTDQLRDLLHEFAPPPSPAATSGPRHSPGPTPSPPAGRAGSPPSKPPGLATHRENVEAEIRDVPAPPATIRLQIAQITDYLRQRYRELDRREQRLHTQLAQFDQERRAFRLETEEEAATASQRARDLSAVQDELDLRHEESIRVEQELQDLRESLLRERHSLSLERDEFATTCEQQRQAFADASRRERREISELRDEAEAEAGRIREELRKEQVLLENRHTFQQEHLQRTMREFEQAQIEFRAEQQQIRTRITQAEAQIDLRSRQLDRIRDLLIDRQQSVERERQWLLGERRVIESRIADDRDELRRERSDWESERKTQKADLRRQHDMLALHAENLEARRQRLDRLRVELEETNRQTLEMRLAVEETYTQLTQAMGVDETRDRVEEARATLVEYYQTTRDALLQQRQELEQLQAKLHQQRLEFLEERKLLAEWVEQQEQQLAARAEAAREEREKLDARELSWREAAETWANEKLQAESAIRDLLQQLDERLQSASARRPESPAE